MTIDENYFDKYYTEIIKVIDPKTCLDIGSGSGRFGKLISSINPDIVTTGVEINNDYIIKHKLINIYNHVLYINAITMIDNISQVYDLVVFGDCLNYMKKSEGIDILNFFMHRSKHILIIYPDTEKLYNFPDHMNHISVWSKPDFMSFSHVNFIKKNMNMIVIKGYLTEDNSTMLNINPILSRME